MTEQQAVKEAFAPFNQDHRVRESKVGCGAWDTLAFAEGSARQTRNDEERKQEEEQEEE